MEVKENLQFSIENIPFVRELGVSLRHMGEGRAELALEVGAGHMNGWQSTHGGVVMTLLDVAMALAGRSLDPQARGALTVEMKTSFLQPAGQPGACLVARAQVVHRSVSLSFCEGELWEGERLVAKGSGTFKILKRTDVARKLDHA